MTSLAMRRSTNYSPLRAATEGWSREKGSINYSPLPLRERGRG